MIIHRIPLVIQKTPTATAQPYNGPQIVEVLDLQQAGSGIAMIVQADETQTQQCDQFVQRLEQPFDPAAKAPNGEPIEQSTRPTILQTQEGAKVLTIKGQLVVVSSYCILRQG